ncbi:hypothetical protein HAX54_022554 [Datura stramonium]|uniref:Uncharacterized protein n=1 Tax=Datura stramonium TaxID=4076 RepID=A0ABS8S4C8_DATST|nr:hypothetical protein [Datura stramonium]
MELKVKRVPKSHERVPKSQEQVPRLDQRPCSTRNEFQAGQGGPRSTRNKFQAFQDRKRTSFNEERVPTQVLSKTLFNNERVPRTRFHRITSSEKISYGPNGRVVKWSKSFLCERFVPFGEMPNQLDYLEFSI